MFNLIQQTADIDIQHPGFSTQDSASSANQLSGQMNGLPYNVYFQPGQPAKHRI